MESSTVRQGQQTIPPIKSKMTSGYWEQLVTFSESMTKDDPVLGEYATLQRLNLIHTQNELAVIKADLVQHRTTTETQMLHLRSTMHEYATAIRDFEYMNQLAIVPASANNRILLQVAFPDLGKRPPFPFNTTYRTTSRNVIVKGDIVREILRKYLFRRLAWSPSELELNRLGYNLGEAPKTYSPFLDKLARFIIAVCGGASLIVPMLIMSFDPSRTKSLITVSVAVVLFALSLSLGFATENKDTLTTTATYAAVLVVFVGTSGTGP